jgi:hypothetical protein
MSPQYEKDGVPSMKLEIALQNFKFERRLCWLLSSVAQADKPKNMDIVISISYVPGTGDPDCDSVVDFFTKRGLCFDNLVFPDDSVMRFRGKCRNMRLKDTKADWILFADADMVYPKTWFTELEKYITGSHASSRKCLFGARKTVPLSSANMEVASRQYPCEIPDAYATLDKYPCKRQSALAAGNCQIVNVEVVRQDHNGVYTEKNRDSDWHRRSIRTGSDMVFRGKMGQDQLELPLQIHLNHHRDIGRHTGQQK